MRFTKQATIGGLVMTHQEGERISINNGELVIEIVQIKGGHIRLAFKAERDVSIKRLDKNMEVR